MSHPGLCAACAWLRVVESRRGSVFFLCGRSKVDDRFPRYPPIPVLSCRGFERGDPDADRSDEERTDAESDAPSIE